MTLTSLKHTIALIRELRDEGKHPVAYVYNSFNNDKCNFAVFADGRLDDMLNNENIDRYIRLDLNRIED